MSDNRVHSQPKIQSNRKKKQVSNALLVASALPLTGLATVANAQTTEAVLDTVQVTSDAEKSGYVPTEVSNVKYTQTLLDTPQTISVITDEVLDEQKAVTVEEALKNVPGITMMMGENGRTARGNDIKMRGFDGDHLFSVDGIRDRSSVSRSTFNVESLEVTKGSTGTESGAAATGGAINLVTKQPFLDDAGEASLGVDSAGRFVGQLDVNQTVGDTSAFRVNAIVDRGDVAGRDVVENESYGIAPSFAFGLGTDTRFFANAELLKQDNIADGGISTVGAEGYYFSTDNDLSKYKDSNQSSYSIEEAEQLMNTSAKHVKAVDTKNFYGSKDDYENTHSQKWSFRVEHDFNESITLSNQTRYSASDYERAMHAPYAAMISPVTTAWKRTPSGWTKELVDVAGVDPANPDTWIVGTIPQGDDRENKTFSNQTNVNFLDVKTGVLTHDISLGLELIREKETTYGLDRPSRGDWPKFSLYNPDNSIPAAAMTRNGSKTVGENKTVATYLYDTVALGEHFKFGAGVRMDKYDTEFKRIGADGESEAFSKDGTLWSYKVSTAYKPVPEGTLYASWGLTQTPAGSNSFTLGTKSRRGVNTNAESNPNLDPSETVNWEIGGKWEVADALDVGIAYFNTTHENYIGPADDEGSQEQYGKRTIKGIELSAAGDITPDWHVIAGVQKMKTDIEEGRAGRNEEGAVERFTPEVSASLWTTYDLSEQFTVGAGLRYVGEQKRRTNPSENLATVSMSEIPSHMTLDLYGAYQYSKNLSFDLNLYNVTNEKYIEKLNNSGYRATMGQPFKAMATMKYKF